MPDAASGRPEPLPPLKTQWFHILTALSREPLHGSGIVRDVLEQTDERLRLWPATLYGSLEALASLGWIEELTEEGDFPEGESRRKRIYRLSAAGRKVLTAEAERIGFLARTALARLASEPTP
ncbi:MAG: PadR family transcriptional regulator [Longimicrobiales bacterium]